MRLYFSRTVKFETTIDNDNLRVINIYLDIVVSAPCQVLSLDTADEVGRHRLDVGDTLVKRRMDKNNKVIKEPFGKDVANYKGSQKELEEVIQAINEGEKCQFEGYFEVNKVGGSGWEYDRFRGTSTSATTPSTCLCRSCTAGTSRRIRR